MRFCKMFLYTLADFPRMEGGSGRGILGAEGMRWRWLFWGKESGFWEVLASGQWTQTKQNCDDD